MPGDDVSEARWKRKRKLLPTLQLKYPNDEELARIASLARINGPSVSSFGQSLRSIVLDAHLNNAALKKRSTPAVKKTLERVERQALQLCKILREMDIDLGEEADGSKQLAGYLIEREVGRFQLPGETLLIPEYTKLLDALSKAAGRANKIPKAKKGPKGSGGNKAFDFCVQTLITTAWMDRGHWTNYRSADGTWTGTLLEALRILKPYLPKKFFPSSNLGRSIQHIREKLSKQAQATQRTKGHTFDLCALKAPFLQPSFAYARYRSSGE